MTHNLLVTVVIPTRDRPALLTTALRSVAKQSYEPIEVVVVDDGSDPPVDRAEIAAATDAKLIRLDTAQGPGAARNAGVSSANGDLIAFLDDDDSWFPDSVRHRVDALLRAGEGFAAVECGWQLVEKGRLRLRYIPDLQRDFRRVLLERPCMVPSSVVIRTDSFHAAGGFDESLRQYEDWDLWLRLADRYRVALVGRVLVTREHHPERDLRRARLEDRIRIQARLEDRASTLPWASARAVRAVHAAHLAYLHADLGEVKAARRELLRAWRLDPLSREHTIGLGRALVGNTWAWKRLGVLRNRLHADTKIVSW